MQRDRSRLEHILAAAGEVIEFCAGLNRAGRNCSHRERNRFGHSNDRRKVAAIAAMLSVPLPL